MAAPLCVVVAVPQRLSAEGQILAPQEPLTRVVLTGIGEIRGLQPATALLFEPGDHGQPSANILVIQAEDPSAMLAFHLRIPFQGPLRTHHEIPGGIADGEGRRQRIELGLHREGRRWVALRAKLSITLDGDRLHGAIESARMAPLAGEDAVPFDLSGHFEALVDVTCWSRSQPSGAGGDLRAASGQVAYRLDHARTSRFCATARLEQGP
jgi:hypothetical protein